MNMQAQLQAALDAATSAPTIDDTSPVAVPLTDPPNTTVDNNTAVGYNDETPSGNAGIGNTTGFNNTAVGQNDDDLSNIQAERVIIDSTGNVGIGTGNDDDDAASSWKHISEVVPQRVSEAGQIIPASPTVQIKTLSEKAILLTLKMSRYGTTKLDRDETAAYGGSHNVYKSLFSGSNNLVKKANSAYNAVYTCLNDHTVPWDKGVRMANSMEFTDLMAKLRGLIATANAAVEELLTNLEPQIAADMNHRQACAASTGKGHIVSRADYPTLEEMRAKYSIDLQPSPVPKANGFDPRHPVTEEDIAGMQRMLDEAHTNGGKHVIKEMLGPMEKAVVNLSTPVEDVKKFYNSIVTNMVDVADRMRRANISDDPEVSQRIHELTTLSTNLNRNTDVLRHSHTARSAAVNDISSLMSKMQGLV